MTQENMNCSLCLMKCSRECQFRLQHKIKVGYSVYINFEERYSKQKENSYQSYLGYKLSYTLTRQIFIWSRT